MTIELCILERTDHVNPRWDGADSYCRCNVACWIQFWSVYYRRSRHLEVYRNGREPSSERRNHLRVPNRHFWPSHADGVHLRAGETWVRQTRTCTEIDDAQFILADLTALVWGVQGGARGSGVLDIRQGRRRGGERNGPVGVQEV
jgi:hypothetical protein